MTRARAGFLVLTATGTVLAVVAVAGSRDELLTAVAALATVCPGWLAVAVLAEAVCYLTRGHATRILLGSAPSAPHPRIGGMALGAITMAGDAVAYCLPLGFAAGGAAVIGQLRRRRVPATAAGWTLTVTTLLYAAVLVVLGIIAVVVAGVGNSFPGAENAAAITLAVALGTLAVTRALRRPIRSAVSRSGSRVAGHARTWWAQLAQLPPAVVATSGVTLLVSWLADIAVLAVAFLALGVHPPWSGLVLAYCAGQLASSVPITPGGLGVVEGSLAATLVAFGGCTTGTVAAVLLYRLVSHWAVIPAGGLAWFAVRPRPSAARGLGDHLADV